MTLTAVFMLVFGFVLLVGGAELLIKGASRLARTVGMSPLVIGLTVVAYGTSAPEFAVNVGAAISGRSGIALGNVIGSNIFNILAILGLSALAAPLAAGSRLLQRDMSVMVGSALLMLLICLDGMVGRINGIVLVAGLVLYTWLCLRQERSEPNSHSPNEDEGSSSSNSSSLVRSLAVQGLLIAGGLVALVIGTRWVVAGAVVVAEVFGISELVIGLTIIAAGTGLPELATSVLATIRGHREIAVGNVVGSCICNVLAVLGFSSLIRPVAVADQAMRLDIPLMLAISALCAVLFCTGRILSRTEGLVFLVIYIGYLVYLIRW